MVFSVFIMLTCNGSIKCPPDGLLVMHESFLQFSLELEDTSKVRMSSCKLWHDLQK